MQEHPCGMQLKSNNKSTHEHVRGKAAKIDVGLLDY